MLEQKVRTTRPVVGFYIAAIFVLYLIGPFGAADVQFSDKVVSIATWLWVPLSLLIAWGLKRSLVGRVNKVWWLGRRMGTTVLGPRVSWIVGILAAGPLVAGVMGAVGNGINYFFEAPYTATYSVTGKYTELQYKRHGRPGSTDYHLVMTKLNDPSDQFNVEESESEYRSTAVGTKMQVTGLRSRLMNKMLSFSKLP